MLTIIHNNANSLGMKATYIAWDLQNIHIWLKSFCQDKEAYVSEPLYTYMKAALTTALLKETAHLRPLKTMPRGADSSIKQQWKNGTQIYRLIADQKIEQDIACVRNWIEKSINSNAQWLDNLDDNDLPKKFSKFHSLSQVMAEVELAQKKYFSTFNLAAFDKTDGTFAIIKEYKNGFKMVQLLDDKALRHAGKGLNNCMKDGSYNRLIGGGKRKVYCLYDNLNRAHAALDINLRNELDQCKGKEDTVPHEKYSDMILEFIEEQNILIDPDNVFNTGFILDDDDKYFDIRKFKNPTYPSTLNLRGTDACWLPDNMTAEADIYLNDSIIKKLPKNLTAEKSIDISDTKIKIIPGCMEVGKNLTAHRCHGLIFPDNYYVPGFISLEESKNLHMPGNLQADSLYMEKCEVASWKAGLELKFSLNIEGAKLRNLPERMNVGSIFINEHTYIAEGLPEDLKVESIDMCWDEKGFSATQPISLETARQFFNPQTRDITLARIKHFFNTETCHSPAFANFDLELPSC